MLTETTKEGKKGMIKSGEEKAQEDRRLRCKGSGGG